MLSSCMYPIKETVKDSETLPKDPYRFGSVSNELNSDKSTKNSILG